MNCSGHTLVIGGSGMLADVCLQLSAQGEVVHVLARTEQKLQNLVKQSQNHPGKIVPIQQDYRDLLGLKEQIEEAIKQFGSFHQVLMWIHSTAPKAPETALSALQAFTKEDVPLKCVRIHGSAWKNPARQQKEDPILEMFPSVRHCSVILGFVVDSDGSRWLTDQEISQGVISALDSEEKEYVVGVVEPWSMRP